MAARHHGRCRMGACETTPTTTRTGETSPATSARRPRRRLFLAPDHRPPLAGLKLVRPRPRRKARRCGRSSLTPARRGGATGSDEEKPQPKSPQPRRPTEQVTGSTQHALLTTGAPMGADFGPGDRSPGLVGSGGSIFIAATRSMRWPSPVRSGAPSRSGASPGYPVRPAGASRTGPDPPGLAPAAGIGAGNSDWRSQTGTVALVDRGGRETGPVTSSGSVFGLRWLPVPA